MAQASGREPVLGYLVRILGRRVAWTFGLVTFVVVFLLAAVNVTSRHALKQYVEDQLGRIPWDTSIYQTSELPLASELSRQVGSAGAVTQTQGIFFLKTILPTSVVSYVDGQPLRTPWLSVLAATDPALLPPDVRPQGDRAVLVLVGSKAHMGQAYLQLQGRQHFELRVESQGHEAVQVFEVPLERTIRIDPNELNRWFVDQTSSPTLIPELGVILAVPYRPQLLTAFDAVSRGIVTHVHGPEEGPADDIHAEAGQYFPDIIHLARLDRTRLVSGWDVAGSLANLRAIEGQLRQRVQEVHYTSAVDATSRILLERMDATARLIGLISLLVSLPLLWMAWVLLANLSGLLILNERRTFGLLRLRGVPGVLLGRSQLLAIAGGGLVGGVAGALLGTLVPLRIYAGGWLPWATVARVQPLPWLAAFLAVGVLMAVLVGRRLVRYASTISPMEASGRVAASEVREAATRFGLLQALSLGVGTLKVVGWVGGWSLVGLLSAPWLGPLERVLDFLAFPLFVYGAVTLLVSRQRWLQGLLSPLVRLSGGRLGELTVRHVALRAHRVGSFLLIVALMASLSLYPTVMTAIFDDKTARGAQVQLGTELQVTLNAPSLVPAGALGRGGLGDRFARLGEQADRLVEQLGAVPGIAGVTYLIEGLVDGVYMPGYGYSGLPLYLVRAPADYHKTVYSEPNLGATAPFEALVGRLGSGQVLVSPPIAAYWQRPTGSLMPVGQSVRGGLHQATMGGTVRFLPGTPLTTVNDRESFVAARIDYLNHLFSNNAYLVAAAGQPGLDDLDVLFTRVVFTIRPVPGADLGRLRQAVLAALPVEPLEVRQLDEELARLGSDMYIFLARQNFQIYLAGGLLLAVVGILSVAFSNYLEDRRTLGLLRVRGGGPRQILQFFAPGVFAPSLIGLLFGALVSFLVGYGITDLVWQLRELQTVLVYLPTRLAVSSRTGWVAIVLAAIVVTVALGFSRWVFRRTVREAITES